MFVTFSLFHPSLIFSDKSRVYSLGGVVELTPSPVNIRLTVANTLAYSGTESITTVKNCDTCPGADSIKLITAVIYKFS